MVLVGRVAVHRDGTDRDPVGVIVSSAQTATTPATIHVRDSKNTRGPRLTFPPAAWADCVSYASEE